MCAGDAPVTAALRLVGVIDGWACHGQCTPTSFAVHLGHLPYHVLRKASHYPYIL